MYPICTIEKDVFHEKSQFFQIGPMIHRQTIQYGKTKFSVKKLKQIIFQEKKLNVILNSGLGDGRNLKPCIFAPPVWNYCQSSQWPVNKTLSSIVLHLHVIYRIHPKHLHRGSLGVLGPPI